MTTSTTRKSLLTLGLFAATFTAHAVPISSNASFLSLPDRDVVRNPYGVFAGSFGGSILPPSSSIVGPNLGSSGGFMPPLLLGGGGGGGGSGAILPLNSGFPGGGSAGSSGLVPPPFGGSVPPSIGANPGVGSGNSGNNGNNGNNTSTPFTAPLTIPSVPAPAESVPDGGSSVILLGSGLLALLAARRRFSRG